MHVNTVDAVALYRQVRQRELLAVEHREKLANAVARLTPTQLVDFERLALRLDEETPCPFGRSWRPRTRPAFEGEEGKLDKEAIAWVAKGADNDTLTRYSAGSWAANGEYLSLREMEVAEALVSSGYLVVDDEPFGTCHRVHPRPQDLAR